MMSCYLATTYTCETASGSILCVTVGKMLNVTEVSLNYIKFATLSMKTYMERSKKNQKKEKNLQ